MLLSTATLRKSLSRESELAADTVDPGVEIGARGFGTGVTTAFLRVETLGRESVCSTEWIAGEVGTSLNCKPGRLLCCFVRSEAEKVLDFLLGVGLAVDMAESDPSCRSLRLYCGVSGSESFMFVRRAEAFATLLF